MLRSSASVLACAGLLAICACGEGAAKENPALTVLAHDDGASQPERGSLRLTRTAYDGACGAVTVENTSPQSIDGWQVDFYLPAGVQVTASAGGLFTQSGEHVIVQSEDDTFPVGGQAVVNYCASTAASNIILTPGLLQ